jgi:hypothetical protein
MKPASTDDKVISMQQAAKRGLTRYFTGKPCKNGHVAERLVSNGNCIECALIWTARWQRHNWDRVREARWRRNNPESLLRLVK